MHIKRELMPVSESSVHWKLIDFVFCKSKRKDYISLVRRGSTSSIGRKVDKKTHHSATSSLFQSILHYIPNFRIMTTNAEEYIR